MSTVTAILEPDADGTLHLPVPEEFRASPRVRVIATFEEPAADKPAPQGRIEISPVSGFPVWVSPPGSPMITSDQVKSLIAEFP